MSDYPEVTYPILGIDRSTPARQSKPGTCQAIENLIPAGPPENPYWSVSTPASVQGSATDILSIGRQTRQRIGPLADLENDPDQSLVRFIALKSDGIYVIDPGQSYQERQLYTFITTDSSRRATFTQLGESVFVSITSGSGTGTPTDLLEVRDDAVIPFDWPPIPLVDLTWDTSSTNDYLPERTGLQYYVFRVAWRLVDGSLGPASGPIVGETPTSAQTYIPTLTIDEYTEPLPEAWEEKVDSLVMIAHAATIDGNGNIEVRAADSPGYIVEEFDTFTSGGEATYEGTIDEIPAAELYNDAGLKMHRANGGAIFSYNKRLMLGDVAYDLYKPEARKIFEWEPADANGTDIHYLTIRVDIRTTAGVITRYSDPIPYENSSGTPAAQNVVARHGAVYYTDPRATRWALYSSTDYDGDMDAATWNAVTVQNTRFERAGAGFSYVRFQGTIDLTSAAPTGGDVSGDTDWSASLQSYESADVGGGGSYSSTTTNTATANIFDLVQGDPTQITFEWFLDWEVGTQTKGSADAQIVVRLLDATDTVLASEARLQKGSGQITFSDGADYVAADVEKVEIFTEATLNIFVDPGDEGSGYASAGVLEVVIQTATAESADITPRTTNGEVDRDPNRIIYSEPFEPYNIPPENAVYAGENNTDEVLALTTVGQPVSDGQFGQYPIICFGSESIRLLEISSEPFISGVSPITTDMGLVGRRAWGNVDGRIVAATDRGVYLFNPQINEAPLSTPLHDIDGEFLNSLDASSTIGYYTDRTRGRREIWLSTTATTWVYSTQHQVWTSLARQRSDYVRADRLYGIDDNGAVNDELGSETTDSFTIVTNLVQFGEPGYLERLRALLIAQRFNLETLNWQLITKDPNSSLVFDADALARATLPSGLVSRDLLPNVQVASGQLVRGDIGTIRLAQATGYEWFLRMEGTAKPNEGITAFGAVFDPRSRHRNPSMLPDEPVTSVITFDVQIDSTTNAFDIKSDGSVAGVSFGDGTLKTGSIVSNTYSAAGTYTVSVIAQPDFSDVTRLEIRMGNANSGFVLDLSTLDLSDLTSCTELIIGRPDSTASNQCTGQPIALPPNATTIKVHNLDVQHLPDSANDVFLPFAQGQHSDIPNGITVLATPKSQMPDQTVSTVLGRDTGSIMQTITHTCQRGGHTRDVELWAKRAPNLQDLTGYLARNAGDLAAAINEDTALERINTGLGGLQGDLRDVSNGGQIDTSSVGTHALVSVSAFNARSNAGFSHLFDRTSITVLANLVQLDLTNRPQSEDVEIVRYGGEDYTDPATFGDINSGTSNGFIRSIREAVAAGEIPALTLNHRRQLTTNTGGNTLIMKYATQDTCDAMVGLGDYHPTGTKQSLYDLGVSISSLHAWSAPVDGQANATLTFTLECDNKYLRLATGGPTEAYVYDGTDDNSQVTPQRFFTPGKQVRVIGDGVDELLLIDTDNVVAVNGNDVTVDLTLTTAPSGAVDTILYATDLQ